MASSAGVKRRAVMISVNFREMEDCIEFAQPLFKHYGELYIHKSLQRNQSLPYVVVALFDPNKHNHIELKKNSVRGMWWRDVYDSKLIPIKRSSVERSSGRLLRNSIKCIRCKSVITSINRHDFRWCECKRVAIDGGYDYLKRVGLREDWIELSEWEEK